MEEHTTTLPEGTMEMTWGLASPGSGEARRKVHLQSQPCLSERVNKSGGEEKMEKVVIQGLANPELGT